VTDNLAGLLEQIKTPKDLRDLLGLPGMTDEVIDRFVDGAGAEVALDRVFTLMAARFKPRGRLRSGIVQWNISTSSGRYRYQLVLTREGATARRAEPVRARVKLAMSAPTLLRLCSGRLDAIAAVRTGRIKIGGNPLYGALLPRWFDY